MARGEAARHEHGVHGVVGLVGAARDQLRARRRRLARRRGRGRGRRPAGSERPVVVEQLLRLPGQRPAQVEAQVDPGPGLACRRGAVIEIFPRQVPAAAPQPVAVRDRHLAVIAQVGAAPQRRAQRRHEQRRAHSRRSQAPEVRQARVVGADSVHHQPHPHAVARAALQARGDLAPDRVLADQEGADLDRARRAFDQLAQRRERLRAVLVDVELPVRRGTRQRHGRGKPAQLHFRRLRVACDACRMRLRRDGLARIDDLARAEHDVQRQRDVGQQQQRDHPRDRGGRAPALAQRARAHDVDRQTERDQHAVQRQPVVLEQLDHHPGLSRRVLSAWRAPRSARAVPRAGPRAAAATIRSRAAARSRRAR